MNTALILARRDSSRVYRKNLQVVDGESLVGRAIREARDRGLRPVVASDDPEILAVARAYGAVARPRPPVGSDETVLESVAAIVRDAAAHAVDPDEIGDFVVVWQPTVIPAGLILDWTRPLGEAGTVGGPVLDRLDDAVPAEGVLYVVRADRGNRYLIADDGVVVPLYSTPRVNDDVCRTAVEVGISIVRTAWLRELPDPSAVLSGAFDVALEQTHLAPWEIVDVDWPHDLDAARSLQRRRQAIAFVQLDGPGYGLGHVRRVETLAAELQWHHVDVYTVSEPGEVPPGLYPQHVDPDLAYDVIVTDCLDVTADQYDVLRRCASRVVMFEHRGPKHRASDRIVNELFATGRGAYSGGRYAVVPLAMRALPARSGTSSGRPTRIAVVFGGTDVAGRTLPAASAVAARMPDAEVRAILGPGATGDDVPGLLPPNLTVVTGAVMVDELRRADVVLTGAGRTVHEAWACGARTVVWPQNSREAEHEFVAEDLLGETVSSLPDALDAVALEVAEAERVGWPQGGQGLVRGGTGRAVSIILGDDVA